MSIDLITLLTAVRSSCLPEVFYQFTHGLGESAQPLLRKLKQGTFEILEVIQQLT